MKREFLEKLGIDKDNVDKIMTEHGKAVQDYNNLKELSKNHETIVEDLKEKLKNNEEGGSNFEEEKQGYLKEIETLKNKDMKIRIARENNIPYELAEKISGTTEEEMIEDARTLSLFVNQKEVLPLKQETDNTDSPYEELLNNL